MTDRASLYQAGRDTSTRRQFLQHSALLGTGLTLGGLITACGGGSSSTQKTTSGLTVVNWISPRGTLEVMDDYNLWVPIKQGYFKDLGLSVNMVGGPNDATATTKFVAQNQADVGYPSPGVLATSITTGVDVYSVWEMIAGQTFDFAVPKGSPIRKPQDLAGKSIAVANGGWQVIIDPMLVEVGVKPSSVRYVEAGQQWGQVTTEHQTDAALCWEGLRAQWQAQGLQLDYLLGQTWSKYPSNVYCVRKTDLADAKKRQTYQKFLQGMVMGFEFAKSNPRAAAQIAYEQFPALRSQMKPQVALVSMMQNAHLYGLSEQRGNGWGFHDTSNWQSYLNVIHKLGQIPQPLSVSNVLTNELVGPANANADVARARKDAASFKLNADFANTTPPSDITL